MHLFDGIYKETRGFSWAMLVSGRVNILYIDGTQLDVNDVFFAKFEVKKIGVQPLKALALWAERNHFGTPNSKKLTAKKTSIILDAVQKVLTYMGVEPKIGGKPPK